MALIKYIGSEETVIVLNGKRTLIKPNKMFSGPRDIARHEGFELLGITHAEKSLKEKSLTFDLTPNYTADIDLSLLDRNGHPKISICIVTKDGDGIIQRCLESISQYVKYDDYEILLCDTGTTSKIVLDYYDTIEKDPKITIYKNHVYNFSKNNNFLVNEAKGEVILFLNNDVFLTYDAISEMIKYIMISNIGCVGHRLVWDDDRDLIQHDGQYLYDTEGKWRGPHHHNYKRNLKDVNSNNCIVEGVTAACLMIRKDLFIKAKGFDEEYKDILQDVALNLNVYKLGFNNVVIREKPLIHIDHGSRKTDGTADSPADIAKYRNDWMRAIFNVRSKVDTSILICATNKKQMENLISSISTKTPHEIVFVNNTKNIMFSSESLNKLTDVSNGEYILYAHQDITFDEKELFAKIKEIYTKLGPSTGIIGAVGVSSTGQSITGIRGVDFSTSNINAFENLKIQCIDEYCLISKRSNKLRFGEYLDHFHFYGADICCLAMSKGLRNYAVNLKIKHHSGGDGNLKKGDGYSHYINQARKFYRHWGKKFPAVATTTAHFLNGHVYYYLGHITGLTPYEETIDVNSNPINDQPIKVEFVEKTNAMEYMRFGESGVSIVILSKDKPEYIKKCISNILKNITSSDYEVLIGDTGTTNKEVLEYYKELPPHIKVIDVGEYHFSKNNNYIANNHAKFNRVLFMNNDVFVNNDIIYHMNKCWEQDVGVIGLRLLYEDGTIQHDGVDMVVSKERNPHNYRLPEHIDVKSIPIEKSNRIVDCVTGACLMMPTKLFTTIGGFDEQYDKVFQDVDLCLNANVKGYKSIICSTTNATHIESGTRDPAINSHDYNILVTRWGNS